MRRSNSSSIFVNISNHPSVKWSEEQKNAAHKLAVSVADIRPPVVDPNSSLEEIIAAAEVIVDKVPETATHAMVSTEYTLTMAIVLLLQKRGVVPVAATTERTILEDKNGVKTSVFRFVQFRNYPDPSLLLN